MTEATLSVVAGIGLAVIAIFLGIVLVGAAMMIAFKTLDRIAKWVGFP